MLIVYNRFEHGENALDGRGRWLSQHDSQRCTVPGGQPAKAGGVPQSLNVTLLPWRWRQWGGEALCHVLLSLRGQRGYHGRLVETRNESHQSEQVTRLFFRKPASGSLGAKNPIRRNWSFPGNPANSPVAPSRCVFAFSPAWHTSRNFIDNCFTYICRQESNF